MQVVSDLAKSAIRVLLVGGSTVGRAGLRLLLESKPGLKVSGELAAPLNLTAAARGQYDVILCDLDRGVQLDALSSLVSAAEGSRILMLTHGHDPDTYLRVFRLGVRGIVLKEEPPEVLIEAIESVHSGELWYHRSMMSGMLDLILADPPQAKPAPDENGVSSLTAREREVMALVAQGLKNKHLAERLFISEATVRHHLTSIFCKLHVSDRFELAMYAYRHGLANPPWSTPKDHNEYDLARRQSASTR